MSNIIDLSANTRIEDMDGVRCLVTDDDQVAIQWPRYALQYRWDVSRDPWFGSLIFKAGVSEYRIPLTDVAPVYEWVSEEMWVYVDSDDCIRLGDSSDSLPTEALSDVVWFHRRAAIVCDTAEQFRALYEELKEARDHAE